MNIHSVRNGAPVGLVHRLRGPSRERRLGPKYCAPRSGDGVSDATKFPDGSERSRRAMKRLRGAVGAIRSAEWRVHIARIRVNVRPSDMRRIETEIASMCRIERCSEIFAFGLIIRHVAGNRYDNGMNAVNRLIDEIAIAKKLVGIVL